MKRVWLVSALMLSFVATAQAEDDEDEGWSLGPRVMERRYASRPLTMRDDSFGVWGSIGGAQLTQDAGAATLTAGADYGIDDDLEVKLELIRLVLSPLEGSGLEPARLSLAYRFLRGPVEIAARLGANVPLGDSRLEFNADIPALIRVSDLARIDLMARVSAAPGSRWLWTASAPVALFVQVQDAFSLGPVAQLTVPNLRTDDVVLNAGGAVAYVFGDTRGAIADLRLSIYAPAVVLSGDLPADPSPLGRLSGVIELRYFTKGPRDTAPFDEDF